MYRSLATQLQNIVKKEGKVVVLLGPRQVGKTTLLKSSFPTATYINIEKSDYINIFNKRNLSEILRVVHTEQSVANAPLILDEVQRLENPGLIAKLIHDELPDIPLIISGSSALEIAHRANESLAGRKITLKLFPLTFSEMMIQTNNTHKPQSAQYKAALLGSMRYGLYPELLNIQEKENYLLELVDSVIFKDIYFLNIIKSTKNLYALLKLLAYQIGQQVNITDLASRIGISRPTVIDYLNILEQTYIVYRIAPYTKKRRDEIGKTEKIYFYDLGIRNAVINDFTPVEYRRDFGSIFENFAINELMKINAYSKTRFQLHYWRTKWGSEVDLVLAKDDLLKAYEIKTRRGTVTKAFTDTYPHAEAAVITLDSIHSLLI